ncbi:hypothetical protein T459_23844 [Capsicum annuum]|uniref:Uncharacterized protein n=1 Tax=Capsicum annuum TaxID=4072 RepID=A0A2G2YTK1_CAPAN|nr:putative ras-related protein Rab11B-like [Capsicum annuum]PHT73059.1 hypothetical protein T459_23844 [Capsicum annuum]
MIAFHLSYSWWIELPGTGTYCWWEVVHETSREYLLLGDNPQEEVLQFDGPHSSVIKSEKRKKALSIKSPFNDSVSSQQSLMQAKPHKACFRPSMIVKHQAFPLNPRQDRFAVQLEFILFCLKCGNTQDAHQGALCLMQERGFDSEPVSNLVVGLAFYQLWYSTIPKELRLQEVDRFDSAEQSETFEDRIVMSVLNSDRHDAVEGQEANSPFHSDSDTSVRNDKEILGVDVSSSMDQSGDVPYHSIFYNRGLPLWLLPLQLPSSNENLEDDLNMHRTLRNDHYRNAIKYLRHALYSSPPVLEAFHPLIQVLLLGDQVKEALDEVENFSPYSNTTQHINKAVLVAGISGSLILDYVN